MPEPHFRLDPSEPSFDRCHEVVILIDSSQAAFDFELILNMSWLDDEHITRISTRLEGLIASLELELRLNERDRAAILLRVILAGLSRCYARQVGSPELLEWSDNPCEFGGFVRSIAQPSIRIDHVQHALSASFGVMEILSASRRHPRKTTAVIPS